MPECMGVVKLLTIPITRIFNHELYELHKLHEKNVQM